VETGARVSSLLTISPGIHLDDTGYESVITIGLFLGMTRAEIRRKLPDIEEFCELGGYLSLPIRTYSNGMLVRLGFAIATSVDPEILVLDEGLNAGDARFSERAKQRVDALIARSSILILASHSEAMIRDQCNKAALLEKGRLTAFGKLDETIEAYKASALEKSRLGT
jgi:ABC-2 type transport system ATP-binding protein/lipopolysaccharide transport system ATP-binding protein